MADRMFYCRTLTTITNNIDGKNAERSHAFPLPTDISAPEDDGGCDHLPNSVFPSVSLPSTSGSTIDPSSLSGLTILFCVSTFLQLTTSFSAQALN